MLIVGEAWGENEQMTRQPFVGFAGKELWRMLGEAIPDHPELHQRASQQFNYDSAWIKHRPEWLEATGISFTNVFNLQPEGGKIESLCETKKENPRVEPQWALARGLYLREQFRPHLARLNQEITLTQPNLIVAAGNTACWAVLSASNIGSIRGNATQVPPGAMAAPQGLKVLPTYHPAGVLRQWSWRTIVVADLIKAWREAQFPGLVRPRRRVLINPTLAEIIAWVDQMLTRPPPFLSCDIETKGRQITCIGFAASRSDALVIPFVNLGVPGGSHWGLAEERLVWGQVRRLLESPIQKLFQNGMYDLQYILRMGFRPTQCEHDTMLFHHSLFPELQKGLGFLGSIYTNEASWKLMRRFTPDTEKRDE
jgi:hypothetical protein